MTARVAELIMVFGFLRDHRLEEQRRHTDSERDHADRERERGYRMKRLRAEHEATAQAPFQCLEELNGGQSRRPDTAG